jgi:hypothetical protein
MLQVRDQSFEHMANPSLKLAFEMGTPVRVARGITL